MTKNKVIQDEPTKFLAKLSSFCRKHEKQISIIGFLIIPLFFTVAILSATFSYEDFYQQASRIDAHPGQILNEVYHYIPRIGELYQHLAIHFMTPQLSFGTDLIFRLFTTFVTVSIFYLAAVFVLGRKLKLKFLDTLVFNGIFIAIIISAHRSVFFHGFSYLHNYAFALLAFLLFASIFRLNFRKTATWQVPLVVLIGILFAMSTEIPPIAAIILSFITLFYKLFYKKEKLREIFQKYQLQFYIFLGVVIGLIIFYIGLNKGMRGEGSFYGEKYEYIGFTKIFTQPFFTVKTLLKHAVYNSRHIHGFLPLLFGLPIFTYFFFGKSKKSNSFHWQLMGIMFFFLYFFASSQIAVKDDLYGRFILPVYFTLMLGFFIFIKDAILEKNLQQHGLIIFSTVTSILFVAITSIDISRAVILYNIQVRPDLQRITITPTKEIDIYYKDRYPIEPAPSKLLKVKIGSPFHW